MLISGLAALGTVSGLSSKLFACDKKLKVSITVTAAIWALYYGLLGAWTGCAISIAVVLRQLLSLVSRDTSSVSRAYISFAFSLFFIAAAIPSWQGAGSLLPLVAALNGTWALLYLTGEKLRWQLIIGSDLVWLAYDVFAVQATEHAIFLGIGIALGLRTIHNIRKTGRLIFAS